MILTDKNPVVEAKSKPEKFVLRLPNGMRDKIASIARQNRRSMNAQIICHLEQLIEQECKRIDNANADIEKVVTLERSSEDDSQFSDLLSNLGDSEKNAFMSLIEAVVERKASQAIGNI